MNLRIMKITFFTVIACFHGSLLAKSVFLTSGSVGGNYHKAGAEISEVMGGCYPLYNFVNIPSNGSNENINNIKKNYAELAIIQRNKLLKSVYSTKDGVKNIEVVTPLFEEMLNIYTSENHTNISGFNSSKSKKIIGFTSETGASYETFSRALKFLEIDTSKFEYRFHSYNELFEKIKNNEINYIVSFSLPLSELEGREYNKIYFTEKEVDIVLDKEINLNKKNIPTNQYTLSVWSYLVSVKDILDELDSKNSLFSCLSDNLDKKSHMYRSLSSLKGSGESHVSRGLRLNESLREYLNIRNNFSVYFIVFLIFVLISFVAFVKRGKLYLYWFKSRSTIIGMCILFLMYFVCAEILILSEKNIYKSLGMKTQIIDFNLIDLHFWLIINILISDTEGIFPISPLGKVMLSLSRYIFFIGIFTVAGVEVLTNKIIKNRKSGVMKLKYKNHIVISGWGAESDEFIIDILSAVYEFQSKKSKIVVVADILFEEILDKNNLLLDAFYKKRLHFIKGDIREEVALEKSNVLQAESILLLSDGGDDLADEKTLLRALSISRHCKQNDSQALVSVRTKNKLDNAYMIAQVNNRKYNSDFINAGVNEIVNSSVYSKSIMVQSITNHGITHVLDEILTYNEHNEFYLIDLDAQEFRKLVGKTYDELLVLLRAHGILLIGVKITFDDDDGREIIDKKELHSMLGSQNLNKQMIINPTSNIEKKRLSTESDQLIVLATHRKHIDNIRKL